MAPELLYRICCGTPNPAPWQTRLLTIKPAILHGFCRYKVRYADYPAVVPQANSTVHGSLVTGLDEGQMFRLDYYEGEHYVRRKVKVRVFVKERDGFRGGGAEVGTEGDTKVDTEGGAKVGTEGDAEGEEVEAEVYVWNGDKEDLDDHEWDYTEFVREKMARLV